MLNRLPILLLPGPTPLPPAVQAALGQAMLNPRGRRFSAVFLEVLDRLRRVFRTRGDVLLFPGGGTFGLEAAVANTLSPGDRVLALVSGFFGQRFAAIAASFGAVVERLEVPWGTAVSPQAVREQLDRFPRGGVAAVLITHVESSTGVANDLEAISRVAGDYGALTLIDAVSSLGAMDVETDLWGLDVVVAASQKALMAPPGAALVAVGPRAWQAVQRARMPRYALSFTLAKSALGHPIPETPYTPPIPVVYALRAALDMLEAEGLPRVIARHARLARLTRSAVQRMGLRLLPAESCAADTVTAALLPDGVDGDDLLERLERDEGVTLAGGHEDLAGRIVRIGHMGFVDEGVLRTGLAALERTLAGPAGRVRTRVQNGG